MVVSLREGLEVSEAVRFHSVTQRVHMRTDYIKVGGSAEERYHLSVIGLTFTVTVG